MVCWCDILPGVHSFACHWYINDKFSLNSLNEWLKFKMDGINKRATIGKGGGRSPLPFFENLKKCPDFGKKGPNCVHPWVESSIQNVILRVSRRKSSKTFLCGAIFLCFWRKVYRSVLIPQNLPCPEKFLVARLVKHQVEFLRCLRTLVLVNPAEILLIPYRGKKNRA